MSRRNKMAVNSNVVLDLSETEKRRGKQKVTKDKA